MEGGEIWKKKGKGVKGGSLSEEGVKDVGRMNG